MAGLVGALAVGGCTGGGDDDPPVTSSTTTSTGSPTTSTTTPTDSSTGSATTTSPPLPSDYPAAARQQTEAGAEAFVRYFIKTTNTAWTKPAAGLVAPLGVEGCKACEYFEEGASGLVADSQRYERDPVTIKSVTAIPNMAEGGLQVRVLALQNEVDIVDAAGRVVQTDPEKALALDFVTEWRGDRWLVYDMAS